MAAFINMDAGFVGELRPTVVQLVGALGQRGEHIQLADRVGSTLQWVEVFIDALHQLVIQSFLPRQRAAFCRQGFIFESLQFWRNETLGIFQRLPALIVNWGVIRLSATDFDVVAMNAVVADFQGADAGAFPLAGFQLQKKVPGVAAEIAQFIQFRVITLRNHAAFANDHGRVFH